MVNEYKFNEDYNIGKLEDNYFFEENNEYEESMNTVLIQEVIRYNVLLNTMKTSIVTLGKGLTGKIVMDEEAEEMSHSLFINLKPTLHS